MKVPVKVRKKASRPVRPHTVVLDKAVKRPKQFSPLDPEIVSSVASVRDSIAHATKNTLWISYARELTEALVRTVRRPSPQLGSALLLHSITTGSVPALATCFKQVAFAQDGCLPPEELAEALNAKNKADLFIGGSVDHASRTVTFYRGDMQPLTVPFSAFEKSGDGISPDFGSFSLADSGQTIRFGEYEAASDAILYEFDPQYRRRIHKERLESEQSFGASLRRLRKQRGLRREDFVPIAAKTIARIEQGKVQHVHAKTRNTIAKRLGVLPDELKTF